MAYSARGKIEQTGEGRNSAAGNQGPSKVFREAFQTRHAAEDGCGHEGDDQIGALGNIAIGRLKRLSDQELTTGAKRNDVDLADKSLRQHHSADDGDDGEHEQKAHPSC